LRQALHQAAFVGNEQLVLLQELCHLLKVTSDDMQAVAAATKKLSPRKCFRNRESILKSLHQSHHISTRHVQMLFERKSQSGFSVAMEVAMEETFQWWK
jgi:hypothetical protein